MENNCDFVHHIRIHASYDLDLDLVCSSLSRSNKTVSCLSIHVRAELANNARARDPDLVQSNFSHAITPLPSPAERLGSL